VQDDADGRRFAERCLGDRHQFRFVVSAEDASEYEDLRPLVRRFMGRMEEDLGTRLDWVAANHLDTFSPHSHVVLRGKDDLGGNLIISPEYIMRGIKERVAEIVNLDLGPSTDLENKRHLSLDVHAERLTATDLRLIREMDEARIVSAPGHDMFAHAIWTGRLRKLETLGLAEGLGHARWRLAEKLEETLQDVSERSEIFRTMRRAMVVVGLDQASREMIIRADVGESLSGRLIAHGFADEISDRQFIIVDGVDGRCHYVGIGPGDGPEVPPPGAIIRVSEPRSPSRGDRHEALAKGRHPVKVELLSAIPLERLPRFEGATWLDLKLTGDDREPVREAGFGREVRSALALRRAWLVEHGLALGSDGKMLFDSGLIAKLQQRELVTAAARISAETGRGFLEARAGRRIKGVVGRPLDLSFGRFVLIENDRNFAIVARDPVLDRALGREVSGVVGRRSNISWTFARERGIEL
jgi:type IV secretory pathway VirD2 relaxase